MSYTPGQPAGKKAGFVYLGSILRKNISSWEEIWVSLEIIEVETRLPNEPASENILHCAVLKTEYEEDPSDAKKKKPKKKRKEHVPDPKPPEPEEEDEEPVAPPPSISPPASAIHVSPKGPSDWPIQIEVIETVQVKDVHRLDKLVYAVPGTYGAREEKIHGVLHFIIEVEPLSDVKTDLHFHFGLPLASWKMKETAGKVKVNLDALQPK